MLTGERHVASLALHPTAALCVSPTPRPRAPALGPRSTPSTSRMLASSPRPGAPPQALLWGRFFPLLSPSPPKTPRPTAASPPPAASGLPCPFLLGPLAPSRSLSLSPPSLPSSPCPSSSLYPASPPPPPPTSFPLRRPSPGAAAPDGEWGWGHSLRRWRRSLLSLPRRSPFFLPPPHPRRLPRPPAAAGFPLPAAAAGDGARRRRAALLS